MAVKIILYEHNATSQIDYVITRMTLTRYKSSHVARAKLLPMSEWSSGDNVGLII